MERHSTFAGIGGHDVTRPLWVVNLSGVIGSDNVWIRILPEIDAGLLDLESVLRLGEDSAQEPNHRFITALARWGHDNPKPMSIGEVFVYPVSSACGQQ